MSTKKGGDEATHGDGATRGGGVEATAAPEGVADLSPPPQRPLGAHPAAEPPAAGPATRTFTLTLLDAPTARPGGDPNKADGVTWPASGRTVVLDLRELFASFLVVHAAMGKFACPHFLVGEFQEGLRRNSAFLHASVVALDVENGPTTHHTHAVLLRWAHVIYTTWSHRPDAHRFRVVLPLSRDVNAEEYKRLWAHIATLLAGGADEQTKDLARALFLPAARPDGGRAGAKAWDDAPLLDPDEVLALLAAPQAPRVVRSCSPIRVRHGEARREAQRRLNTDPVVRRRAAEHLKAKVRGSRADGVLCPRCERASVWFWIEPGRLKAARCDHLNSCGWWGHLDELLDTHGAAHV